MKNILTTLAIIALMAIIAVPAGALSLYEQEGTSEDGTPSIDATGQGDSLTNWQYQFGYGSWAGVYAASDGWYTISESGDMDLEVEADIEMYLVQSIEDNKVYFHFGNVIDATGMDKTAFVNGVFSSNNGQWVGLSFLGTNKTAASFENVGGVYTGRIFNGMVSLRDTWRTQNKSFDLEIQLDDGTGPGFVGPGNYGDGAHGTITDSLWWLIANGEAGTHAYTWRILLIPETYQADGDYYLDPALVSAPVM